MKLDSLTNGVLQFVPEKAATPEKIERKAEGGVVINNITPATAARPAHFETTFFISCVHEVDGISAGNMLHLKTIVPTASNDHSYREVEDQACRTLPDLLRALAVEIEKDIARADAEHAARTT